MPNSQINGADNSIDVSGANTLDVTPINQKNQTPTPKRGSKTPEQFRLEQARINDVLSILLIVIPITASVVTFCITRSLASFGFLSLLSMLPAMRRRIVEALFPISAEDLQIKMKELDVEIERIRKHNTPTILHIFTWLKRFTGR
jgi:hypothetical protein